MESLRSWAVIFCVASVASAFMLYLVPSEKFKKPVNVVISLFLLAIMLSPFSGTDIFHVEIPEISIDTDALDEDYSRRMNDYLMDLGEAEIENEISSLLSLICGEEFSVKAYTEADGEEIRLSRIELFLSQGDLDKSDEIIKKVGAAVGAVPEIRGIE